MKILMTGATGLIGKKLFQKLYREGHDVVILTRQVEKARLQLTLPCELFPWNPTQETPPAEAFKGVEAVIHLAGEPIGTRRWTPELKRKIEESRVLGTQNLIRTLTQLKENRPKTLLSASAIGYYGSQDDRILDEESPPTSEFLSRVCQNWEAEANRFLPAQEDLEKKAMESRVVTLRIGIVLANPGGALDKLLPLFRAGLGGQIGDGKNWMSWIHIDDLVDLIHFCLIHPEVRGPVNAVSPFPVTNQVFTSVLSQTLAKSAPFQVPLPILKVLYGEMAVLVFSSQRVAPKRILEHSFEFRFPTLQRALEDLCPTSQENTLIFQQFIPKSPEAVFPFFSEAANLEQITPEWLHFKIKRKSTTAIEEGTLIDYQLSLHGLPIQWQSRIESWSPNDAFVDRQVKGPYKKWHHTHTFQAVPGGTLMTDIVRFQLPLGALGKLFGMAWVRKDLNQIFDYRRKKINDIFLKTR